MTRRLTAALSAAVLLTVLGVSARASTPERTVGGSYLLAGGVSTGTSTSTPLSPAVTVTARGDEDRVRISTNDSTGTAIALAVDITPPGGDVTRRLLCGGGSLPVAGGSTVAITPLSGRCADGRVSLPGGGRIEAAFHRTPPPPAPRVPSASPEQRFALVVGIEKYAGRTHDTVGGVGDVLAVKRALIGSGWRQDHILTLTDQQATASAIRAGLTWLRDHSSPKTFSVFHYSGHTCIASRGPCASGHAYLWSHDNQFIPEDEIVDRLKQVQGKQWFDASACEGGAYDRGYSSPDRLFTGASAASETAYEEPEWNRSVWTGLAWDFGYNRGAADPSGAAYHSTIAQLATYGQQQAPVYTKNQSRGPQHPVVRGGSPAWTLTAPPGG